MEDFNIELLEITKDNLEEAQFMAANFIDKGVQNRIFLNVAGAEALISYLDRFKIDISSVTSIHSIKRIVEKIDIADVILKNIHIDVRVVFDENMIFIPKSHRKYGIVPDVYAVLKYDKSVETISFLGFFEPSEINLNSCNDDYYFISSSKLSSPFDFVDFVKNFKGNSEKSLTQEQILRGRELSVNVADHDISDDEFTEFLGLLSKSRLLRASVLEYDNFETLASRVAYALQIKQPKKISDSDVVNIDDFMSMGIDSNSLNSQDSFKSEDLNGDSLLDDGVISAGVAAEAPEVLAGGLATDLAQEALESVSEIDVSVDENSDIENYSEDSQELSISDVDIENQETADLNDTYEDNKNSLEENSFENNNEDGLDISSDDISDLEIDESAADFAETFSGSNTDENTISENDISYVDEENNKEEALPETEQMFEIQESDIDFSDFEDDMSEQASEDFMNLENSDDSLIGENDVSESQNDNSVINMDSEIQSAENVSSEVSDNSINESLESNIYADDDSNSEFLDFDDIITEPPSDILDESNTNHELSDSVDENPLGNDNEQLQEDDVNLKSDVINSMDDNSEISDSNKYDYEIQTYDMDDLSVNGIGMENAATSLTENQGDNQEGFMDFSASEQNDQEAQSSNVSPTENGDDSNYELFEFSDLAAMKENSFDNSEVSFEVVDDFESFESIAPTEESVDISFTEEELSDDSLETNNTKQNSTVITDKNFVPGEIFIDINADSSSSSNYTENEHLEELYTNSALRDSSGLNNDVRIVPGKPQKQIPIALGIGGLAFLVVILGIIVFSVYKFMTPANQQQAAQMPPSPDYMPNNNNLGTDVPHTANMNGDVVMHDDFNRGSFNQNNNPNAIGNNMPQNGQVQSSAKSIPPTSFLSVKKLSWEVPDYVSYDPAFKQYFQSSGKSLKAALTSDLLLASDYTYSDQIKVTILFDKMGNFKNSRILLSSGSGQVDNIVLQSVNQTLRVLKAPNSLGNDQSTTVILKIYL